ncbi:succinyl-diaminopimelate desuccinylase [Candidatus Riesia pediculischaeffi]|uniref:Succinyl-diaminopimelate desuccinylase n=1 Tax=Candidatus Riesia pediculischaeffi PTSU TaxID=1401651 RepID=A0A0C1S9F1_9ENTR|nr:succinyl-diaminopimelate desuccinylase [Candidatus Riesia pediculischaeffi]KIE63896.1 N-succinyl-L,L-diaminopimelate desuccinylase [Candidatus Riesia pediculischaeffi PTSU]
MKKEEINKMIELLRKMIEIPSINPYDLGCQNILIEILKKIGFSVEEVNFDHTKNFFASHGVKKGKVLLFVGHTDVVNPGNLKKWKYHPFKSFIKDGTIYGRGSSDMKGAIASMISATKIFIKFFPKHTGKLAFLITSDEEGSADLGTKKVVEILKERNEKIDYCIIGEPTSELLIGDTIKNSRRGSLNLNIISYHPQGHVAYIDPIQNPANSIVPFLKKLIFGSEIKDRFSSNVSTQITKIVSDSFSDNITPSKIDVRINFRFNRRVNHDFIKSYVFSEIKKNNLSCDCFWKLSANPFHKKSKNLISFVEEIIERKFGYVPKLSCSGGTSDGRFLTDICNQIVEIGLLNRTIHQINERVHIQDLIKLSTIYLEIMKKILL